MDICIDPQLLQSSFQFLPGELLHTLCTTQIEWTETRKENFQIRIMKRWREGWSLEGIRREIEGVLSFRGEILEFATSKEERGGSRQFSKAEKGSPYNSRVSRLAQENPQGQSLPILEHINYACQLHHKQRDRIEWIFILRLKNINRPDVDVLDVITPEKSTKIGQYFSSTQSPNRTWQ